MSMQISQIDPQEIEISETLQAIPLAPPEVADLIMADVVARGIDVPLILNKDHELLDGRIRLRGALAAGLPEVPCIVREDGDAMAATIILASLCQRKHYTKSALAYISFPLVEDAVREARDKRLENLRRGDQIPERVLSTQSGNPRSVEDICESIGISRKLLYLARNVHGLFAKQDGAREKFEPFILSGELSLGEAIQGIAGWISTKGKSKQESGQLDFFHKLVVAVRFRFSRFTKLAKHEQTFVANEFAGTAEEWPEAVQEAVERKLKQLKKHA
jgi:hypothetical protein